MTMREHFRLQRLHTLESRYRATRRRLTRELMCTRPDVMRIQALKQRLLLIKDQIAELVRPLTTKMPIHG